MRLAMTVEHYFPAIGGSERVAQRVSEGLAARGHEVHVITGTLHGPSELNGVHVHRLAITGNEVRGIRGDAGAFLATIDHLQPELVFNYATQTWPTDCSWELLQRAERPRMVLAPCGFSRLHARRYAAYFAAMPDRLRRYDAVTPHSSVFQDFEFCARAGVQQLIVVPNGADAPAPAHDLRARFPGRSLAVTIGSHVYSKGHRDFARATRALGRDRALTGVIVAPPRRGLDALRGCQLACSARERMRGGDLVALDGTAPAVVADALAAADLFLFTSHLEVAPLVVLEAMAAGTPWVSYAVGNVSELPGGIVARSFDELVTAAGEVLDGAHPQLGAEGCSAWQASHRWDVIVERYESVFEEVLRAPVSARSAARPGPGLS